MQVVTYTKKVLLTLNNLKLFRLIQPHTFLKKYLNFPIFIETIVITVINMVLQL